MSALSEDTTVPTLDNWITTTEVAALLGITRQHAYRLIADKNFGTLHKLGTPAVYVVDRAEVERFKLAREKKTEEVSE